MTALGCDKTFVVAHDIGNMVAYAYAAIYPDKVERLVVMDAPIPGIEPWSQILPTPGVWHFNFHGPDAERLVQGRERIYFDRIWNDFTGDPSKPDEATSDFFAATYAQPGGMRAGFAQFTAFTQDAADNKVFEQVKLTMPVLAVGGEKSFGPLQALIMRHVATHVQEAVVLGRQAGPPASAASSGRIWHPLRIGQMIDQTGTEYAPSSTSVSYTSSHTKRSLGPFLMLGLFGDGRVTMASRTLVRLGS